MPKIDALYLYSSYMYIHIWPLFNSIKGTTLYTNIVEASLFDFIEGVSSPYHFHLWCSYWFLSLFSVTVLNVQFHRVFPSLDFIWNIWRTFKFEQSLNSAHTGLKKYKFLYKTAGCQSSTEECWGGEWSNMCHTESVHTRRNIPKIIIQLLILPAIP